MTTSPSENRSFTSVPKGSSSSVGRRRTGVQQPVEFGDPLVEADQFVGALDGVGGVGVIADGTAVVADFGLQPIPSFLQPGQLGGDALACLTGKPRGLDFFAHLCDLSARGMRRRLDYPPERRMLAFVVD